MVFSSLNFLFVFLPVVLLLYYIRYDITWRNVILLLASIVFYAWGEPVYVILMMLSIGFNYLIGRDLAENGRKKITLVLGVIVNLLLLGYFKYSGFVVDTINSLTGLSLTNRELPLPIGISFYTFQALSYLIDVYRRKCEPQKSFLSFAVYISMFPQLIAGPIVKYEDVEKQLTLRRFSGVDFGDGVRIFVKGLAKKVILANGLGALYEEITAIQNPAAFTAWIGVIAFALQLFNDFSGYSDMAIGLGKMLGFTFPKNFDRPFFATSVGDFWRKWHISLGSWFREYVYIPLGGNRKGAARQILNLAIVWALTGLWHGASWNFVLWGVYCGTWIILERFVFARLLKIIPGFVKWFFTSVIMLLGWVLFFSNSIGEIAFHMKNLFGAGGSIADGATLNYLLSNGAMMIIGFLTAVIAEDEQRKYMPLKWILTVSLFVMSVAFLVSDSYNPFLYFRF